jgi:hypothetical protein
LGNVSFRYLQRTVESILRESPAEQLIEIVIVDDSSHPPLSLSPLPKQKHKPLSNIDETPLQTDEGIAVRIMRLEQRQGLIRCKNIGAREATGSALRCSRCTPASHNCT